MMTIRSATKKDIPAIMDIIKDAQLHLANQNIDQWQDGYPTNKIIENDIANNEGFVVVDEHNTPFATTMFTTSPEPTYTDIEGKWSIPVSQSYGVIHRLAISAKHRNQGLAKRIFQEFEKRLMENNNNSMKVDTHRGNTGMQHMLTSIGYQYCGVIYLESGDERLAFEKVLKKEGL
jgi:ribosomal protein S18 acetylase RimI-like enzyme